MRKVCPCCGYYTAEVEDYDDICFEICPVCFWQYDAALHDKPDMIAASHVSLNEARKNYKRYGACKEKFKNDVRPPFPEELPENNSGTLKAQIA
jgi:hypothetical protein